ncbi:hypothetical protein [uncultured Roseobacter sp.]|uniref:hypothetical protein n=1 Tax=uncultured Roseobacter sp. TaxID=114847 RepID=UPI00261DBF51|nr:hypothetical protein [uncultured Roseobacter sp.]
MNVFVKKVSLAALVVTVIGTGFSGQARAGDSADLGKLLLGAIAVGVVADRLRSDRQEQNVSRQYHNGHRSYHQPQRHQKKKISRKRLHGKGPRHSGFHRHGDFGHTHSYNRAHSH